MVVRAASAESAKAASPQDVHRAAPRQVQLFDEVRDLAAGINFDNGMAAVWVILVWNFCPGASTAQDSDLAKALAQKIREELLCRTPC